MNTNDYSKYTKFKKIYTSGKEAIGDLDIKSISKKALGAALIAGTTFLPSGNEAKASTNSALPGGGYFYFGGQTQTPAPVQTRQTPAPQIQQESQVRQTAPAPAPASQNQQDTSIPSFNSSPSQNRNNGSYKQPVYQQPAYHPQQPVQPQQQVASNSYQPPIPSPSDGFVLVAGTQNFHPMNTSVAQGVVNLFDMYTGQHHVSVDDFDESLQQNISTAMSVINGADYTQRVARRAGRYFGNDGYRDILGDIRNIINIADFGVGIFSRYQERRDDTLARNIDELNRNIYKITDTQRNTFDRLYSRGGTKADKIFNRLLKKLEKNMNKVIKEDSRFSQDAADAVGASKARRRNSEIQDALNHLVDRDIEAWEMVALLPELSKAAKDLPNTYSGNRSLEANIINHGLDRGTLGSVTTLLSNLCKNNPEQLKLVHQFAISLGIQNANEYKVNQQYLLRNQKGR